MTRRIKIYRSIIYCPWIESHLMSTLYDFTLFCSGVGYSDGRIANATIKFYRIFLLFLWNDVLLCHSNGIIGILAEFRKRQWINLAVLHKRANSKERLSVMFAILLHQLRKVSDAKRLISTGHITDFFELTCKMVVYKRPIILRK